jgi:hypothetical protein
LIRISKGHPVDAEIRKLNKERDTW